MSSEVNGQPISNNGIAGFPTMANFKKMEKLISLNSMAGAFGKTLDNSDDNPTEPKSPSTDPAKPEALYAKKYSFGNVKILKSNWRGDSSKLPRFIIEDPDNVVELGTTPWQIGCKLIENSFNLHAEGARVDIIGYLTNKSLWGCSSNQVDETDFTDKQVNFYQGLHSLRGDFWSQHYRSTGMRTPTSGKLCWVGIGEAYIDFSDLAPLSPFTTFSFEVAAFANVHLFRADFIARLPPITKEGIFVECGLNKLSILANDSSYSFEACTVAKHSLNVELQANYRVSFNECTFSGAKPVKVFQRGASDSCATDNVVFRECTLARKEVNFYFVTTPSPILIKDCRFQGCKIVFYFHDFSQESVNFEKIELVGNVFADCTLEVVYTPTQRSFTGDWVDQEEAISTKIVAWLCNVNERNQGPLFFSI